MEDRVGDNVTHAPSATSAAETDMLVSLLFVVLFFYTAIQNTSNQ